MLRQIYLYGHLADRFGERPTEVDITTPVEAVRALTALYPGFRDELRRGAYHVLIKHGDKYFDIGEDQLALQLGQSSEVHIAPAVEGAKRGGALLKIVLGVALVAGAFFMAPAAAAGGFGAAAFGVGGMGITYGQIAMIGIGLAVAGVSQLLAPQAKTPEEKKDTSSFIIAPSENTVQQGVSVPMVIGRYMVGSVVMSVGIATEQIGSQGIKYPGQG